MSRFTTSAVDAYLKLIRRPVDMAVGLLPGRRTGPAAAAKITVDRVDATVRSVVGSALRDDTLRRDGQMRAAAADERERAIDLRQQAQQAEARSEEQLQERHEKASRRREQASNRAATRQQQAEKTAQTRAQRARETEQQRLQAAKEQEAKAAQRIESEANRERLPGVEEQAKALEERETALAQAQEAERIGDAAARVKAQRKS
jgi:hypothetical protein